jgi:hypothetical protein
MHNDYVYAKHYAEFMEKPKHAKAEKIKGRATYTLFLVG